MLLHKLRIVGLCGLKLGRRELVNTVDFEVWVTPVDGRTRLQHTVEPFEFELEVAGVFPNLLFQGSFFLGHDWGVACGFGHVGRKLGLLLFRCFKQRLVRVTR